MNELDRFISIQFHNYKCFKSYKLSLEPFNILVGPNNCGKSTILGSFRILAEGIRKACSKNPILFKGPDGQILGYPIDLRSIPVALENVFYNYDDSNPASIRFKISNGNELILFFPVPNCCFLICDTIGKPVYSVSRFKSEYNVQIGHVPILGPVEHDEQLYQKEAARLALLTHRAARNFRNIWFHFPEYFEEFKNLVRITWPGLDIEKPETDISHQKPLLRMFCPEERIPREIYWAGFGFQVWCQMLTYIVAGKNSSVFIIDEPDIYLHSDLQRQLIGILKSLGPDIIIATHSIEIITEADPNDLIIISKKDRSAKRIKQPGELQEIFQIIGSNLNPILTQLAKTKRAIFVEGKDFQIISRFAKKLNMNEVAIRSDFAVIPVDGFNPSKVRGFISGIETTLGNKIFAGVIFDRDYRTSDECRTEIVELQKYVTFAIIHNCKELENFLLVSKPIKRAIQKRISERNKRTQSNIQFLEDVHSILENITNKLRTKVEAQFLSKRRRLEKTINPQYDESSINKKILDEFNSRWEQMDTRLFLVPGKEILAELNSYLQNNYGITITPSLIIESFAKNEIPLEMVNLIEKINVFRQE